MYSVDAMYLMLCTALVESNLSHLRQLPSGPALGLFQMEPDTYTDVCRYLNERPKLLNKILLATFRSYLPSDPSILITDLSYSSLMARVKYWMIPEAIPTYKDPQAQATYYEKYYNANKFVDKTSKFISVAGEVKEWITDEQ